MRMQFLHCHSESGGAESKDLKGPSEGKANLEGSYAVFDYWSHHGLGTE